MRIASVYIAIFIFLLCFAAGEARADCASPAAEGGTAFFNADAARMQ